MGFPGNPPYQFNQLIPYAFIHAAELRVRGINEQFIAHLEEKRPQLQRFVEQHQMRQSTGGTVSNTPGLGMGLSGLPGAQSQQTQLQHQMILNAPQQMPPMGNVTFKYMYPSPRLYHRILMLWTSMW